MTTATKNAEQQLKDAAELIGGKAWGMDKAKPRIYMPSRKDMKVYFTFDDWTTDELGGARLCIYINDCGQPANWYPSQKAKVMDGMQRAGLALCAFDTEESGPLPRMIMESEEELSNDQLDAASRHLMNGRIDEAMEVLNL